MTLAIKTTDAFTRTAALSGSTLDNANGGSEANTWTIITGTWNTSGGRAVRTGVGNGWAVVASTAAVGRQKVTANSYGNDGGVVARRAAGGGEGTLYLFYRNTASPAKGQLFKFDGTNFTQLGSTGTTTIVDGDAMALDPDGTTITALLNGVSEISVTDSTYATGVPGIYSGGGATGQLDNFKYEVEGSASGFFLMF